MAAAALSPALTMCRFMRISIPGGANSGFLAGKASYYQLNLNIAPRQISATAVEFAENHLNPWHLWRFFDYRNL
jgi:hypothetical protein